MPKGNQKPQGDGGQTEQWLKGQTMINTENQRLSNTNPTKNEGYTLPVNLVETIVLHLLQSRWYFMDEEKPDCDYDNAAKYPWSFVTQILSS